MGLHIIVMVVSTSDIRALKLLEVWDVPSAAQEMCDGAESQGQALCNSPFSIKLSDLLAKTLRLQASVPWGTGLV